MARRIFKFPQRDELLYIELNHLLVEDVICHMMEDGAPLTPTLKRFSFLPKFKLMISILYLCYLGLLGSFDQVFANQ